jgi:hypothetical protein
VAWAAYAGGGVRWGTLVARVAADGALDMRYSHVNEAGELMTGRCRSVPETLPDGRLRLHETWQWTCAMNPPARQSSKKLRRMVFRPDFRCHGGT